MNFLRLRRWFKRMGRNALVLVYAIRHPETPRALKLASIAALAYVISPIDLMPDIPLLGWIDDAVVLGVLIPALLSKLPAPVARQSANAAQSWIDRMRFGWRRGTRPGV